MWQVSRVVKNICQWHKPLMTNSLLAALKSKHATCFVPSVTSCVPCVSGCKSTIDELQRIIKKEVKQAKKELWRLPLVFWCFSSNQRGRGKKGTFPTKSQNNLLPLCPAYLLVVLGILYWEINETNKWNVFLSSLKFATKSYSIVSHLAALCHSTDLFCGIISLYLFGLNIFRTMGDWEWPMAHRSGTYTHRR